MDKHSCIRLKGQPHYQSMHLTQLHKGMDFTQLP